MLRFIVVLDPLKLICDLQVTGLLVDKNQLYR